MTAFGAPRDDWPEIFTRVMAADILVLLTPIWLGEKSSVATRVVERLYGNSAQLNRAGQYAYYGQEVLEAENRTGARTYAASAGCSSPATRTARSTAR